MKYIFLLSLASSIIACQPNRNAVDAPKERVDTISSYASAIPTPKKYLTKRYFYVSWTAENDKSWAHSWSTIISDRMLSLEQVKCQILRRMDEEGTQNKVTQMFTEKDISVSILEFKDDVDYAAFLRGSEDKLQMDTCLTLFECEGDIRVK